MSSPRCKIEIFTFFSEKLQKVSCKNLIQKAIFFNFLNISPLFCPRLSQETNFHFKLLLHSLIVLNLKILVFEKSHSLFKLIFKATQLREIPEYDIFRKILHCFLALSINLGLNVVPVAAGQYSWKDFTVFFQNLIVFWVSMDF